MCNHFFPLKVECREILKKERKFNFFFFKRRGESGIFAPSIRKNDLFDKGNIWCFLRCRYENELIYKGEMNRMRLIL